VANTKSSTPHSAFTLFFSACAFSFFASRFWDFEDKTFLFEWTTVQMVSEPLFAVAKQCLFVNFSILPNEMVTGSALSSFFSFFSYVDCASFLFTVIGFQHPPVLVIFQAECSFLRFTFSLIWCFSHLFSPPFLIFSAPLVEIHFKIASQVYWPHDPYCDPFLFSTSPSPLFLHRTSASLSPLDFPPMAFSTFIRRSRFSSCAPCSTFLSFDTS